MLASLPILLTLIGFSSGYSWKETSLDEAHPVTFRGFLHYFCQAKDEATGNLYTGTIKIKASELSNSESISDSVAPLSTLEGSRPCTYTVDRTVKTSNEYKLLVSDELETLALKYGPLGQPAPSSAVKCLDAELGADCRIGLTIYGDGICDETAGKANHRFVFYTNYDQTRVKKCPFITYIVSERPEIDIVINPNFLSSFY